MTAAVYIVHCVDAEGPLYESLVAKFERLEEVFGISDVAPTADNLRRLQEGSLSLAGRGEEEIRQFLSGHRVNCMESWTMLDAMLEKATASAFRHAERDSLGRGWVYNWFCMDHVHYTYNPRRRDIGYHNIFDKYLELTARDDCGDGLHWHFHPPSTHRDAHRCATHYFRTPDIFDILTRKVIERGWFPSSFRAGFQAERPDSHWFLEQWIPFDLSNMALDDNSELDGSLDFRNGRSADWRGAPADWSVYHPSHDDWRRPGQCRRAVSRTLNVLSRIASIDQCEMDKAFVRASDGKPAVVGVCSHDWRDITAEVDFLRGLVRESRRRFPDVTVKFSEAAAAFREALWPGGIAEAALDFDLRLLPAADGDVPSLEVRLNAGRVFGPQPFLAIETRGRQFFHDNFDFDADGMRWFYAFHGDTLPLDEVARIGVAANDRYGNTCVRTIDVTRV